MTTDENIAISGRAEQSEPRRLTGSTLGDEAAFTALYEAQVGRALAVTFHIIGDMQLAEDAVHQAFAWLWEHPHEFDPTKGPPEALLLTVVRRRAVDRVRERERRRKREALTAVADRLDSEAVAIVAALDRDLLLRKVRKAVRNLGPDQREALELAYFGGLTQAHIADLQRVPVGTVKSRLRAALKHLRQAIGAARV